MSPRNAVEPLASLPAPPATLPLWAKVLYYLAETIAVSQAFKAYDWGAAISGQSSVPGEADPSEWRRFVYRWSNFATNDTADDQYMSFDVVNITGGHPDSTWTGSDYTAVTNSLNAFMQQLAPRVSPYLRCTEVKAYIRAFNDYSNPKPYADSGPPDYVDTFEIPGTGAGAPPPQVSSTITEITAVRPHWGRFYLPTLSSGMYANTGFVSNSTVDAILDMVTTAYSGLMGNQFFPVVPTTVTGGKSQTPTTPEVPPTPTRTLQTISSIRMDNVADVQRRRRYKHSAYTVTHPLVTQTLPATQPTTADSEGAGSDVPVPA